MSFIDKSKLFATMTISATGGDYNHLEVAIALSLYAYNVSPRERAQKLYDHFHGDCMEGEELMEIMETRRVGVAATELPMSIAAAYVVHALETYGEEAQERVKAR